MDRRINDKNKVFLGSGCSRMAWSFGDGTCLKMPIKVRLEAGIWQNKLEYENFELAEKEGLVCFPKAIDHNRNFTKIVVEECSLIEDDSNFLKAFNLPEKHCELVQTALKSSETPTFSQFVGFWILGWLEEMTIEQAYSLNRSYPVYSIGSEKLSYGDLEKIMPFEDLDDIFVFLELISDRDVKLNAHAALVRSILDKSKFLCDILRFKLAHPNRLFIKDLWNIGQYGISQTGKLVVIDAGYNHAIANSKHFARGGNVIKISKKTEDFDTFNGEICSKIHSPTGSPVEWKFFTSRGTEYILSSENQARRIKQAGLNDDGLYPWMDRMVFVDEQDAIDAMNTIVSIQRTLTPVKLETTWESGTKLDIQKLVQDQWQTQLSVTIQDTKPQIGKNVLEFMLDGCIVKSFHAGHDVTKLKHFPV